LSARLLGLTLAVAALSLGCARYPADGGGGPTYPSRLLSITVEMADALNTEDYYFVCFDDDGDPQTGPLPVVQGPEWGNGWGTGTVSGYVEYHANVMRVYHPRVLSILVPPIVGGITEAAGNPTKVICGRHRLNVDQVTLGAASVSAGGMIQTVSNVSDQNAGTLTVATDAAGAVTAASVVFTPATAGGRALTAAEQAAVDALNAGGVALAPTSLQALGLTLQLSAAAAGTQTVTIAPTTGSVTDRFDSYFGINNSTTTGVLNANDHSQGPTPPIPGVTFTTKTLTVGDGAQILTQFNPIADDLGTPFEWHLPTAGARTLSFKVELDRLGTVGDSFQFNVITTDLLELSSDVRLDKSYDGLGPDGTTFVTLSTLTNRTFVNGPPVQETTNDVHIGLLSPPTFQPGAIDIKDWTVDVQLTG
jgi:hypothetical protein